MLATLERPETVGVPIPATEAVKLIREGRAPEGLRVNGHLSLAGDLEVTFLPRGLAVASLDLSGCVNLRALPEGLQVSRLNLAGCRGLTRLPSGLRCYELDLKGTRLTALPDDLRVEFRLDLSNCTMLRELPLGLKVGSLVLEGCIGLSTLPEGLETCFLDISDCAGLTEWPKRASVRIGRLNARGCSGLTSLPSWLTQVAQLDLCGCERLTTLPEGLRVSSWLDLADTGITTLPDSLAAVPLRWKGVPIDARIAFHPETIRASEVLDSSNAEQRRVLLERMGYEAFLQEAQAQLLDRDADPGGERRLLKVPLLGDEDLVCIAVFCPSTARQYIIRVPPTMRTCHQAAAWIAGFDNANDYRPVAET